MSGRIPRYESRNNIQVVDQGSPFGNVAQHLGNAGNALAQHAEKRRRQDNAAKNLLMDAELAQTLTTIQTEYADLTGTDRHSVYEDFNDRLEGLRGSFLTPTGDRDQDAARLEIFTRRTSSFVNQLLTQQTRDRLKYQAQVFDTAAQQAELDMQNAASDEDFMDAEGRLNLALEASDMPQTARDLKRQQIMSNVHTARFEVIVKEGKIDEARSYLEKFGDRVNRGQKAGADSLLLAEERKILERQEKAEEDELKLRSEAVYRGVMARLHDDDPANDVTVHELDKLYADRRINQKFYDKSLKAIKATPAREDNDQALVRFYQVLDADPAERPNVADVKDDLLEAYSDGLLTLNTMRNLRGKFEAWDSNAESVRETQVKHFGKYIGEIVGGVRGPAAILDADSSVREANAKREYYRRVESGESPKDVADDIVERYLTTKLSLGAYPKPRYLQGEKNDPAALEAARQATAQAFQSGEITKQQAVEEAKLIQTLMGLVK